MNHQEAFEDFLNKHWPLWRQCKGNAHYHVSKEAFDAGWNARKSLELPTADAHGCSLCVPYQRVMPNIKFCGACGAKMYR